MDSKPMKVRKREKLIILLICVTENVAQMYVVSRLLETHFF